MTITLKNYNGKPVIEGIERVSKPSRRIHCGSKDIPRVRTGQGTVVISTSKGILSGEKAAELLQKPGERLEKDMDIFTPHSILIRETVRKH